MRATRPAAFAVSILALTLACGGDWAAPHAAPLARAAPAPVFPARGVQLLREKIAEL